MIIDGWHVREARAEQRRLVIGHHNLKNNSEWNAHSNRPVFVQSDVDWKPITVELLVKGDSYQDIVKNTGTILSKLKSEVTMTFDRTDNYFDAILDKFTVTETVKDRWHILKLEFLGYEYAKMREITASSTSKITIDNEGNMDTPVTLIITPRSNTIIGGEGSEAVAELFDADGAPITDADGSILMDYGYEYGTLYISGMCTDPITGEPVDITIRNLSTSAQVRVDGDTGAITEGGDPKIDDVDIWSLPSIKPGINVISTNAQFIDLTVQYKPRFQ